MSEFSTESLTTLAVKVAGHMAERKKPLNVAVPDKKVGAALRDLLKAQGYSSELIEGLIGQAEKGAMKLEASLFVRVKPRKAKK